MHTNERGFTLIETLVATVVLTIGIFALYSMQVASMRGNLVSNLITQSSTLSALQIERMLAGKFSADGLKDSNGNGMAKLGETPNSGNAYLGLDDGKNLSPRVGLTACRRVADHCTDSEDGQYRIVWNVANDYPTYDVKTIRVHVRNRANPNMNAVTYEMVRNNPTLYPERAPGYK